MGLRGVAAGANPSPRRVLPGQVASSSLRSNVGFSILLNDTSTCSSALPRAGIWTSDLPITRRPALSAELQPIAKGTNFHCFWECKWISRFWTPISKVVGGIFKIKFKKDPRPSRELHLAASHYKLFEKLLVVAQKCILKNWIKTLPPNVTLWYREVFYIHPNERLQAVVK